MKFSMNGFRRTLSGDVETLRDIAQAVAAGHYYDQEDFVKAVNQIITHSNVLNCVYETGNPDFTDMGDLEVDHLEMDGEGQQS